MSYGKWMRDHDLPSPQTEAEQRRAVLAECGLTYDELVAHAAAGTLPTERARIAWLILMPDDLPATPPEEPV